MKCECGLPSRATRAPRWRWTLLCGPAGARGATIDVKECLLAMRCASPGNCPAFPRSAAMRPRASTLLLQQGFNLPLAILQFGDGIVLLRYTTVQP